MPARNRNHDAFVAALRADGWTITHDPFPLIYDGRNLHIDLGAERRTVAATRQGVKIAVEIRSFLSESDVEDLEKSIGQYKVYEAILTRNEPDRILYLAVPKRVAEGILAEPFGRLILDSLDLRFISFDEEESRILSWSHPL